MAPARPHTHDDLRHPPTAQGEIHFDARRIDALKSADIVGLGLGHVPEGRQLFPSMTVEENLLMGPARGGPREAAPRPWQESTTSSRLSERQRQVAGTLSGGEQQMLAIGAGSWVSPGSSCWTSRRSAWLRHGHGDVRGHSADNRDGTTILLVEQNVFRALKLSHRGYILEDGRVVAEGPSEDLLRNPQVRTTYLGL